LSVRDQRILTRAVAAAGALLGVVAVAIKHADGSHPLSDVVLTGLSGFLFLGAGVFAQHRRPDNGVGLLMVVVGVAVFAEDFHLSRNPLVFTAGLLFAHASAPAVAHLVLAFPTGTLPSRPTRLLVVASYVDAFVVPAIGTPFADWPVIAPGKPPNLLLVSDQPAIREAVHLVLDVAGAVIAVGVVLVLVNRWRTEDAATRRLFTPVTAIALAGAAATTVGGVLGSDHELYQSLLAGYKILFCLWPLAFAAGVLRAGPRPSALADLLVALREPRTHSELRDLLARTLRDDTVRLDVSGDRVRLVSRGTEWEDPRLLDAVESVARLVAGHADVRAAGARLVAQADAQRRQVERDLHDGAQQRLVAVALGLRLAQQRLGEGGELAALLTASADGLDLAMAELRDLARGIHPAILTESGVVPAVATLIERTPLPVEFPPASLRRYPAAVEATAYFVVAEAVTNALKHAGACRVRVCLAEEDGFLLVRVSDDGVGGATPSAGSGLSGLRDRVAALGGWLTVASGPGTTVEATIPLGGADD
jgi:signal transduction histidine kinase